jgi:hypothetical protein
MKRFILIAVSVVGATLIWPRIALAEYTLLLKNGRRITVQAYREEGGMIKFYGLGGEIGIPKDQIQAILEPGAPESRGMVVPRLEEAQAGAGEASKEGKAVARAPGEEPRTGDTAEGPAGAREKVLTPEEQQAAERAKEEKEYQRRVKEITEQIKTTRDRYALGARGSSGPEPSFFTSEEAFRSHQDDLISRLRDAQHNPLGPSDAKTPQFLTPSPFSGIPPTTTDIAPLVPPGPTVNSPLPGYSDKQKELSDLRSQIGQLMKERERLIEEMKQKNFETGSLFLE